MTFVDAGISCGMNYGCAIGWRPFRNRDVENGLDMPYGVQKCRVFFDIDREMLRDFHIDMLAAEVE